MLIIMVTNNNNLFGKYNDQSCNFQGSPVTNDSTAYTRTVYTIIYFTAMGEECKDKD